MKKLGAGLVVAAVLPGAFAQTNVPAGHVMSLSDCIGEAIQHNLDVQYERYNPQIDLYAVYVAYSGYDPVLSISGTHSHNDAGGAITNGVVYTTDNNQFNSTIGGSLPLGTTYSLGGNINDYYNPGPDANNGSIGLNVTQPLLKNFWINGDEKTILISKNSLKRDEQQLRLQIINSITAVENAYDELIFARENLTVQEKALELAQTQLGQDQQRVQFGSLAPLDVQQDEAQVAQNRANLIAAQYALAQDQNTLKGLITDDYAKWHDQDIAPADTLTAVRQLFDVQDSWGKGLTQRPDLLQAKLDIERQGIVLKFDKNQLYPELDLKGSYGFNGAGGSYNNTFGQYEAGNRPYYSYGAQVSIPLSNAGARDQLKADKLSMQQYLLKLKQLEQSVMVAIDDAVKQAESALESVDATKQARVYAEAALDAEEKKYSVGKSTTFTVLQLQNNLTAARSQEIRALANYAEAIANLSQQEGSTIERHHLNLQIK